MNTKLINYKNINSNSNLRRLNNLLNVLSGYTLPGRAFRFAQTGRNIYRYLTGTGNYQQRKRFNNGIEVNKADGGWKSPSFNGRVIGQTINMKFLLIANRYQDFEYYVGTSNDDMSKELNIQSRLNNNDEFLNLRKQALQYKVKNICVSINYDRVPKAGERWNKLMITPETDLIEDDDPLLNKNTMQLDMTKNGTKNYNFRITRKNTEYDNSGWIIGQAQFSGLIKLHFSELDMNIGDDEATTFPKSVLGTIQVAVRVVYVHKDINDSEYKKEIRITKNDIKNYVVNKIKEEREQDEKKE